MLSYPPVARVLTLLSNGEHLTKYEIGKKLGFVGEAGFTSLPLNVLIMTLATTDEPKEKNKIKTDWDGSSDKYARMISGWLVKLGLLVQRPKLVTVDFGGELYSETIGHAYMITDRGLKAVRRLLGINKVERVSKNVFWEMFATKGIDKNYIRTRRAYILKILIESNKVLTLEDIKGKLKLASINESINTIKDDINGLINTGINIKSETTGYKIYDSINDFIIPKTGDTEGIKSNISLLKDELRGQISHISHDYLSLIDLAFDSKQNRLFEMKVLELLVNEYGFKGRHLGGSRKPDGIVYSTTLEDNFGIIVDTKAYSEGYSLPISQADEMERYVRENSNRDEEVNPNKWWENFSEEVKKYYFVFISGSFKGKFEEQLRRLSMTTGVNGSAVNVVNLIEMLVASVVPYAESKNLNLIFDTNKEDVILKVDSDKLERIILNLLSNAIKFSKPNGEIRVTLNFEDCLYISVTDNGIGIAKENLNKIFDKFTQLDTSFSRKNEGSGIGLSIVKSFVLLHNGKISVKSELNKGTSFLIELPLTETSNIETEDASYDNLSENVKIELSDIYI